MAIKKKISELPESTDFTGLWTIGVNALNKSVKVSLQYIATKFAELTSSVTSAVSSAETATGNATSAASSANTAATSANTAAGKANAAASNADKATSNANTATSSATEAAGKANQAANAANTAKEDADKATEDALDATEKALKAVEDAETATGNATSAADRANSLVPTSMELRYPRRITFGNLSELFINAELSPATVAKNLLYLGDGKAVEVTPDGRLTAIAKGTSTIHVIPTANTALYRSIQIVVGNPTLRFASSRSSLRLMKSGGLRLT